MHKLSATQHRNHVIARVRMPPLITYLIRFVCRSKCTLVNTRGFPGIDGTSAITQVPSKCQWALASGQLGTVTLNSRENTGTN
jgi:hypothetical protein